MFLLLKFGADLSEDFVVSPCRGRVRFLMVIWFKNQIARRQQDLFHFWILLHFLPGGGDDQTIMLGRHSGTVFDLLAIKGDLRDVG